MTNKFVLTFSFFVAKVHLQKAPIRKMCMFSDLTHI